MADRSAPLPRGVQFRWTTVLDDSGLTAGERTRIRGAVPARRAAFASARRCARECLRRLGEDHRVALLSSHSGGAPIWPVGIVGSLTHCAGLAAAAVGRAHDVAAVGIDAEPDRPLPEEAAHLVLRTEERAWLRERDRRWATAVFSAKESVYKAWSPLTGAWLGFEEAVVRPSPSPGRFVVDLDRTLPDGSSRLSGAWLNRCGFWLTAVTIPERVGPGA